MTIAAAYLVSEGVVLGADSSSTVFIQTPEGSGVAQLLHHAQKVFEIGEESRLGLCTWGAGNVGKYSHRTIIAQLADRIKDKDITVDKAAQELYTIADPLVKEEKIEFVGYYIGGWDPETHEPACSKLEITQKEERKIDKLELGMCSFSGMPVFFTRVFRGFDPRLPQNLLEEIKKNIPEGDIKKDFDKIFEAAFKKASDPLVAAGFKDLPIREAIDFVYSYLHISIKASKFMYGAPASGGPIEIGFVTTDRLFRWACHKTFTSAMIEPGGG
jgi:hypothetical protein